MLTRPHKFRGKVGGVALIAAAGPAGKPCLALLVVVVVACATRPVRAIKLVRVSRSVFEVTWRHAINGGARRTSGHGVAQVTWEQHKQEELTSLRMVRNFRICAFSSVTSVHASFSLAKKKGNQRQDDHAHIKKVMCRKLARCLGGVVGYHVSLTH